MSKIVYLVGESIYINLTNACPCSCAFCLRQKSAGYGSAESLWLDQAPTAEEVLEDFRRLELGRYKEVVFCGYGEPFCALPALISVCQGIKSVCSLPIRVNTNGLGDLLNGRPVAPLTAGLVDTMSISLNTSDPELYLEMCKPVFGIGAHAAILAFAADCKKYVPQVIFTVVDVITPEDIRRCYEIAAGLGISLRVRGAF